MDGQSETGVQSTSSLVDTSTPQRGLSSLRLGIVASGVAVASVGVIVYLRRSVL
jgi:hypothetical protein